METGASMALHRATKYMGPSTDSQLPQTHNPDFSIYNTILYYTILEYRAPNPKQPPLRRALYPGHVVEKGFKKHPSLHSPEVPGHSKAKKGLQNSHST